MKLRFRSLELLALLFTFLIIGFTAGYLYTVAAAADSTSFISEKIISIAVLGMLLPFFFGLYLISRGVYGLRKTALPTPKKPARKKHHLQQA